MSDLERFRPFAYAIARPYFLPGADRDDVEQEAMIGVWKALRDYRPDGGMSLRSFVALCVRRQVITAVKTATREKHRGFLEAVRETPVEDDELSVLDALASPGADPAEILESREEALSLLRSIATELTPLERRALIGLANGYSYDELGPTLGGRVTRHRDGSPRYKRAENAVIRARQKLALPPTTRQAA